MVTKKSGLIKESYGDYLKAIYMLSLDITPVSTSSLAKQMSVTNATASDMIRRLHKEGHVHHVPYKGTSLTATGEELALCLLRRHRLWEVFLTNTLKVPLPDVHQYAELLEHATDESLEDYLAAFLQYPKEDPHGNPIPTKDGKVKELPRIRLTHLQENQPAKVIQFTDEDPELLEYLYDLGIRPGIQVTVQKRIPYDGSLQILADKSKNIQLGKKIANTLIVSLT